MFYVLDGRQLRAARAILGWTTEQAAEAARLHRNSVSRTEALGPIPFHSWAADKLGEAYEAAGVRFCRDDSGPTVAFDGQRSRMTRREMRRLRAA